MKKISFLKCIGCGKEHELRDLIYTCDVCGSNLEVIYDYALIKKRFKLKDLENNRFYDIWRYVDLLPADDLNEISPLRVGYTPLYRFKKLADEYDVEMIYIKDDSLNPSLSSKDRATAVVLKRMVDVIDVGRRFVACVSQGNIAASTACLAASVGVKSIIFIPSKTPEPRLIQVFMYGAGVIKVDGSYDDAYELCKQACDRFGWFNRNSAYNPFTREGKKTISFEIAEQLEWEVPDVIFVPVGNGNIISGIWKGFLEFKKIGFIDKLPKLVAVQAGGSNAIFKALSENKEVEKVNAQTICVSISVSMPRDAMAAINAVRESNGFVVNVSDDDVLSASLELSTKTGVFAEPSAASSFAGFKKARSENKIESNQSVLLLISGYGVKDMSVKDKMNFKPGIYIKPDIKELERYITKIVE